MASFFGIPAPMCLSAMLQTLLSNPNSLSILDPTIACSMPFVLHLPISCKIAPVFTSSIFTESKLEDSSTAFLHTALL